MKLSQTVFENLKQCEETEEEKNELHSLICELSEDQI